MLDNLLEIKNLSKTYHSKNDEILALDNVSFKVKKNEFISIVGPSGCGKSTILSILANVIDKSTGEIIFDKESHKFGYMLQKDSLFDWLNVYDNCLLGLKIMHLETKENINRINRLLKMYGLEEFKNKYPDSLSGGMRQRVALIRTLASNPDILFLDEPFSALDYQTRLSLADDLYKIVKLENKTVIMVTHDIAEAISLSDKIIVLTKRPSKIKNIHEIHLKDKTTPTENRKDEYFIKYYDLIWKELDHHV